MGSGAAETTNKVTNISEQLMQIDNSIKQSIEQNCSQSGKQSNVINVINSKLQNATLNQKNAMKNLCALQASFDNSVSQEAQNKIAATVAQHAAATGGGLMGGDAKATNVSETYNKSQTFINNSQVLNAVKNCVMRIEQSNIANIINSDVSNTSFTQANDSFSSCLQTMGVKSEIESKAAADTETTVDQTASAAGGSLLGPSGASSASLGSFAVPLIISIIVSCLLSIAYFMFTKK